MKNPFMYGHGAERCHVRDMSTDRTSEPTPQAKVVFQRPRAARMFRLPPIPRDPADPDIDVFEVIYTLACSLDRKERTRDERLYLVYLLMKDVEKLVAELREARAELARVRERLERYREGDPSRYGLTLGPEEYRRVQAAFARAGRCNLPIERRIEALHTAREYLGALPPAQQALLTRLEAERAADLAAEATPDHG